MPRTSADDFWRMAVYGETFFDRNHDRRNERDEVARAYVIGRVAAIRFVLLPRRAPENHHAFAAHLPHRYQADFNSPGYAHCTTVNFVLHTLLARSRYFTRDDIRVRHTFFNGYCISTYRFVSEATGLMRILRHRICTSL